MPRFVVLRHDVPSGSGRELHWDFMLEAGDLLLTWKLAAEPASDGTSCFAERLPDHRPIYLVYEGEVSGGRGTVSRFDGGDYHPIQQDGETVIVRLSGARLRGTATLARCGRDDQRWRFTFTSDGTTASGLSCDSMTGDPSDSRGTV
jgi:hypothetical protein